VPVLLQKCDEFGDRYAVDGDHLAKITPQGAADCSNARPIHMLVDSADKVENVAPSLNLTGHGVQVRSVGIVMRIR
jgi:hypothetical protein